MVYVGPVQPPIGGKERKETKERKASTHDLTLSLSFFVSVCNEAGWLLVELMTEALFFGI